MIPDFKTYIKESVWGGILDRGAGDKIRKEDDVDGLDFKEFSDYLKNHYEVQVDDSFFEIGQWIKPGTNIGNISIPIEANNQEDTPNLGNRMLDIQIDLNGFLEAEPEDLDFSDNTPVTLHKKYKIWIKPNKYVFRLYPNELRKTFGDKYNIDGNNYEITPKDGKTTNNVCIDVLDKLLGMVENPILKKIS